MLAETDVAGTALKEYVYLNGAPLALIDYDQDGDGVRNADDNCINLPNGYLIPDAGGNSQLDADADGYGNLCDADFNQNGVTNTIDLGIFKAAYGSTDSLTDLNGDGFVNTLDLGRFKAEFGTLPGPSGPNGGAVPAEIYSLHNDHLGTPMVMTDESGTIIWRATYDPFGRATVNEDPDGDGAHITMNVRFPGQYYDQETGCHYNLNRYYCPDIGRYLTADPIGLKAGLNSYSYTENNPVKNTDRYGLETNICLRPLGGTPQGATFPVINHTYGCVGDTQSGWTCDSTAPNSGGVLENTWPFGQGSSGKPSNPYNDYYDPKSCHKVVDDNKCVEQCILKKWGQDRPWYQVGPGGTDCQEYTYYVIISCESSCRSAP